MKNSKVVAGLLCLVLVLVTFGFSAQDQKKLNFYAGAGAQLPLGDWSNVADMGFHLQAGVLYPVFKMVDIQAGLNFFIILAAMNILTLKYQTWWSPWMEDTIYLSRKQDYFWSEGWELIFGMPR